MKHLLPDRPGRAWLGLATLLGGASLLAWWMPSVVLDWQPDRALQEPWRAFSAAWVHWSALHLMANLSALTIIAALGVVARLPLPAALAWALAWPLTQLGLSLQPALAHYGGLSGVLHAGVAVAGWWILGTTRGRSRAIAAAILAGLLVKLVLEEPWGPPLRHGGGWDIATAPLAHATGAMAGSLCAGLALLRRPGLPRQSRA